MIFYANGCSYTAGSEIEGPGIQDSELNKKLSYSSLLYNKLGLNGEYINDAICGSSNQTIVYNTIEWIEGYRKENKKLEDLFVLIGFTSINRIRIYYKDNWLHLTTQTPFSAIPKELHNWFRNWILYGNDNKNLKLDRLHHIFYLKTYLENLNINFVFVNCIGYVDIPSDFKNKGIKNIITSIQNMKNYFYPFEYDRIFIEWANEMGFDRTKDGRSHHIADAHEWYSEKLYKWIKINELINI
jgi:hypothetical protein